MRYLICPTDKGKEERVADYWLIFVLPSPGFSLSAAEVSKITEEGYQHVPRCFRSHQVGNEGDTMVHQDGSVDG